jgi:RHS repeat-associated protein
MWMRFPGRAKVAIAFVMVFGCGLISRIEADIVAFSFGFFPAESRVETVVAASSAIANFGAIDFQDVVITISAPPEVLLQNGSSSVGTCVNTDPNTIVCDVGVVGVSGFVSYGCEATSFTPGTYTVAVAATSTTFDPDPNNNIQSAQIIFEAAVNQGFIPGVMLNKLDPVSTFSGKEVFTERPDLDLGGGALRVFLQRHYDGAIFEDGFIHSALGPGWQHNYDLSLSINGTNATVGFSRGRIMSFEFDGANWNLVERTDIPFALVESGPEFILGDPGSQWMYFFDNTNGLLRRIEDGRGSTNRLSYSGMLVTNVTDTLNRSLSFSYDGSNRLVQVTDNIRQVNFGYTGNNLTSSTNAIGEVTSYSYDGSNTNNPALLTARTLPEGNTPFSQVYNSDGRVESQIDAAGNTNSLVFTPVVGGRQAQITDPLGHSMFHIYTGEGELSGVIDQAGNQIVISLDGAGRRSNVRDRHNDDVRITYDNTSGLPTKIDFEGIPDELLTYASRTVNGMEFFDLTAVTHPDGTANQFEYDVNGNQVAHTNRVGDVWAFGYNSRGQLLSVTNPVGGEFQFTYDANGRPATSTDTDVGVTTLEYDSLNRLTNVIHPNPDTVQYTYDSLNRLTSVTDERTSTTTYAYDGNSRLTNVTDALNRETLFQYDEVDRLVAVTDRLGETMGFGYEPRSLLETVTNRNGFITRFEYDERRRLTALVNPGNVTNRLEYDAEGLVSASVNPLGEAYRLQRDRMGYITGITDPLTNRYALVRDEMKRTTGITDPLGHVATFAYDNRGLLTDVAGELSIAASYEYSPLGVLTNASDPNFNEWRFEYTATGRLTDFTDPLARSIQYAYDSRGRLDLVSYADGVTLTNGYDSADNPIALNYSDGTALNYEYDALGRLTNAAGSGSIEFFPDPEGRPTNTRQAGVDFGASFDADGRLTNVTYNSGQLSVTYGYDSLDRLVSVGDSLTSQGMTFAYDDADRIITITRDNGVNTTYTYDPVGRVTRVEAGGILDLRYTIDAAGRVTRANIVTAPIDPTTVLTNESTNLAYDAAAQISSAGYAYDSNGRLTNAPDTSFSWDGASRLVGIDSVSLGYNALGDLVTRAEGGNTNRYFYNYAIGHRPIVAERDDNAGQFKRIYVWTPTGLLLYIINLPGNTVSYPHFDRVGSTLALTDEAGVVTDAYAYDAFGRVLAESGSNEQPFLFVGRSGVRREPAGNLWHMRARYYDPQSERFLSRESLWPLIEDPKKLNPYQYALLNPVRFIDPAGTTEWSAETPLDEMSPGRLFDELDFLQRASIDANNKGNPLSREEKKKIEEFRPGLQDTLWKIYHDDDRYRRFLKDVKDAIKNLRRALKRKGVLQRVLQERADRRRALEEENKGNVFLLATDPPVNPDSTTPGDSTDPKSQTSFVFPIEFRAPSPADFSLAAPRTPLPNSGKVADLLSAPGGASFQQRVSLSASTRITFSEEDRQRLTFNSKLDLTGRSLGTSGNVIINNRLGDKLGTGTVE